MKTLVPFYVFFLLSACNPGPVKRVTQNRVAKPAQPAVGTAETAGKSPVTPEAPFIVIVDYTDKYSVKAAIGGTVESVAAEGAVFKQGGLLFQLDNRLAFESLVSEKQQLIDLINDYLAVSNDAAWQQFSAEMNPYRLLPQLPEMTDVTPARQQLAEKYAAIHRMETDMRSYFTLATTAGTVLEVRMKPGSVVRKGDVVLIAGKTSRKGLRIPGGAAVSGKMTLTGRTNGKMYTIDIPANRRIVTVPQEIPAGSYLLGAPDQ